MSFPVQVFNGSIGVIVEIEAISCDANKGRAKDSIRCIIVSILSFCGLMAHTISFISDIISLEVALIFSSTSLKRLYFSCCILNLCHLAVHRNTTESRTYIIMKVLCNFISDGLAFQQFIDPITINTINDRGYDNSTKNIKDRVFRKGGTMRIATVVTSSLQFPFLLVALTLKVYLPPSRLV